MDFRKAALALFQLSRDLYGLRSTPLGTKKTSSGIPAASSALCSAAPRRRSKERPTEKSEDICLSSTRSSNASSVVAGNANSLLFGRLGLITRLRRVALKAGTRAASFLVSRKARATLRTSESSGSFVPAISPMNRSSASHEDSSGTRNVVRTAYADESPPMAASCSHRWPDTTASSSPA